MSLRSHSEQAEYEHWVWDTVDALEAEGLQVPTDWATRYHMGQTTDEIVREMRTMRPTEQHRSFLYSSLIAGGRAA